MFFKILTIIALVQICSGGAPKYPQEHNKSNRASYSQSFVREDIPLSYQYSAVHVYSPKQSLKSPENKLESKVLPLPNNNKPGLNPMSYPVQYAPIPYKREDLKHQNEAGLYTQVTSPKYYDEVPEPTKEYVRKPHLEPELELSNPTRRPQLLAYNQFVPGHNIQVLPTPNRSPVSNNYHKINPQSLQEHSNVENYLRQFTIRHETEQPVTISTFRPKMLEYFTVITTESPTVPAPFAYVPAEYYSNFQRSFQPKDNDIQLLRQAQVLQPMPSRAKDTKLQLNIARTHKVAQMPHQDHTKHGHFQSYPLHTEAIYKPNILRNSGNKGHQNVTRLFPMTNHLQNFFAQ